VLTCAILHLGTSTAPGVEWNGSESIEYNLERHDFLGQALYGRAFGTTAGATNPSWSTTLWYYDGASTRRVGFYGGPPPSEGNPSYTSAKGYEVSGSEATLSNIDQDEIISPKISKSGLVAGWSTRYCADGAEGKATWVFDPATNVTERIGYYTGHEPSGASSPYVHGGSNGYEKSEVTGVNGDGKVIGFSWYFSSDTIRSKTAWIYDGSMKRIGLFEAGCADDSYYHSDAPLYINENGWVAGNSSCGAFLYDGSGNTRMGFQNRDGTVHSAIYHSGGAVSAMNDDGEVIGITGQKSDNASTGHIGGQTAWLYSGSATHRIGLYTAEYIDTTDDRGFSSNTPLFISPDGKAAGWTLRKSIRGQSAWQYNGSLTQRIGLYDESPASDAVFTHTSSTGEEGSMPVAIANGGNTIGDSTRYKTATAHGNSSWYFNGSQTTRIGFFSGHDPLTGNPVTHTRADGYEESHAKRMNSSGAVIGVSKRYASNNYMGTSGWFYDPASGTSHLLVPSLSPGGAASVYPQILTDAGEVYGSFVKYDGHTDQGWHLFYWTLGGGFRDISEEAGGILTEGKWKVSTDLTLADLDSQGNLIGSGYHLAAAGDTIGLYTPFVVHAGDSSSLQIVSLSPGSAPVGTEITIYGSGFGASKGSSVVKFNGVKAQNITSWSNTRIKCTVPTGATTGPVKVKTSAGTSNALNFTVTVPPVLTSLSPASGKVAEAITITGRGFGGKQGTSVVTFNGVAATEIVSWSKTQITCKVPAGATSGPVKVSMSKGVSNEISFTVVQPPVITSLSPASGKVKTVVTITGQGFRGKQGSSAVTFKGTPAKKIISWSKTQIVCKVPAGAKSGPVRVTTVDGRSNKMSFTVE